MRLSANCLLAFVLLACPLSGGASGQSAAEEPAAVHGYRVVASFPHDPHAFTQGLLYRDGFLYESTGRDSELRKVRLETGEVIRRKALADDYFGEGLTVWRDRLIQLTWKSGTGLVHDLDSLRRRDTFSYPGEGWGLTQDGTHLIMSDGSARLRFLDPETFALRRELQVADGAQSINGLNELEYVRGEIYANVYEADRIARIEPQSGQVLGWIDLGGLRQGGGDHGVLNGIAYDADGDRLFVTGKLWPRLFEIELTRP